MYSTYGYLYHRKKRRKISHFVVDLFVYWKDWKGGNIMKKTDNWKKAMEVRKKRKMKSLEPKKERPVSPITLKRIVRHVLKKAKDPDTNEMKITFTPQVCFLGEYILVTVMTNVYYRKKYVIWRRAYKQDGIETALKNNGVPVAVSEHYVTLTICGLHAN